MTLRADDTLLVERPRKITTKTANVITGVTFNEYAGDMVTTSHAPDNQHVQLGEAVLQSQTQITGYDSYTVTAGASTLVHTDTPTQSVDSLSWSGATISNNSATYNLFGGLISSTSHAIGQSDVSINGDGNSPPVTDGFGRVTSLSTSNGLTSNVGTLVWFGPSTATGPDHEQATYTYTPLGQIATALSLGVTTTYAYDAAGNVTSVEQTPIGGTPGNPAADPTVKTSYDAMGRMTSYTDALGNKTTYAYDDGAHTVTTTQNAGTSSAATEVDAFYLDGALKNVSGTGVTPVAYDEGVDSSDGDTWTGSSIDPTAVSTDGGGAEDPTKWSYSYTNVLGQNYKQTTPTPDGGSATATTLFDGNGRPYQTTDFGGSVTKVTYDPMTGLAGQTTVVNTGTSGSGSTAGASNGPDRKTSYRYFNNYFPDSDGNVYSGEIVTQISSSGNVVTVYEEANGGLISREIDNATLDGYNHITGGLITSTVTAIGTGAGEATVTTTMPDGTKVQDNYSGDLLQTEQQLGSDGSVVASQSFGYDALNRNTSSVDPVFGTTTTTLRLDGSVSGTTMPGHAASTVNTAQPTTNVPTSVTRPDGGTDTQTVNLLGQVTSQSGAGITPANYGYDAGTGQLNDLKLYPSGSTSDPTGMEETQWGYNAATGALTSMTFADSTDATPDKLTYNYGGARLQSVEGQGVTTSYGYNAAGEQTTTTATDGTQLVTKTITQQDDQGRPTQITGTTTDGSTSVVTTNNLTYQNGNLTNESQAAGVTTHYDYYGVNQTGGGASPGAIADVKLMQGGAVISETDYVYNSVTGRLQNLVVNGTTFTVSYLANSNVVQSVGTSAVGTTWSYNTSGASDGDLAGISTSNFSTSASDYSASYTYTANDQRLTENISQQNADSTTDSHSYTYGYDGQNQLTTVTDNNTGDVPYAYNYDGVGNQTGTSMGIANALNEYSNDTYNTRGDETGDGTQSYTWNAANQLTAVTANDNSFKDTFQYDGQNRLIEKDAYDWNATTSTWSLSGVRKLVYDGTNLVAELDGSNHLVDSYVWGPNGLMSVTDFTTTTPPVYMAALDGNGDVVQLDNATTGAVAADFTYTPYGKLLTATGPAADVGDVLSDGGGYYVRNANIVSDGNRFVSTGEGHWLSPDPAGIAGGSNLFVYCGNDPVNSVDPTGLAPTILQHAGTTVYYGASGNGYVLVDGQAYRNLQSTFTTQDEYDHFVASQRQNGRDFLEEDLAADKLEIDVLSSGGNGLTISYPGVKPYPEMTAAIGYYLADKNARIGAPPKSLAWIPLLGSGWQSAHHFSAGHWGKGVGWAVMALADLAIIKSLGTAAGRLAISRVAELGIDAPVVAADALNGLKSARSLIILNQEFTPARNALPTIFQGITDRVLARLASDTAAMRAALTYKDVLQFASGFSPNGIFGNILEREIAAEIASSAVDSQLFMWTKSVAELNLPGVSTIGDFIGIGIAAGEAFEVTTVGQAAAHAARWGGLFGELVHIATYLYPF